MFKMISSAFVFGHLEKMMKMMEIIQNMTRAVMYWK